MNPENTTESKYINQTSIAFYHANGRGSGSAVRFEFKPPVGNRNGFFFMEMAAQKTTASDSQVGRTAATFGWEKKATIKLGFMDICACLAVFRSQEPGLGENSRGLYHANGNTDTVIGLRRNDERKGYSLSVSRKDKRGEQLFKGYFLLSPTEAIGLEAIFSAALFPMAYGWPRAVA